MNEIKHEYKSGNIPIMPGPDFQKDFGRSVGYADGKNDSADSAAWKEERQKNEWSYELLAEMRL